jgi:hypothetical protein
VVRVGTPGEEGLQTGAVAAGQEGALEFQQRVLQRIHVHGVHLGRVIQQVLQRVAPGAGDHGHPAARCQPQKPSVDPRILPAGVVDERGPVHGSKEPIMRGAAKRLQTTGGGGQGGHAQNVVVGAGDAVP